MSDKRKKNVGDDWEVNRRTGEDETKKGDGIGGCLTNGAVGIPHLIPPY